MKAKRGWRIIELLLAGLAMGSPSLAANPFAPLTAREIRATVRMVRAYGRVSQRARFSFIALEEPPKEMVLRGETAPRRSFAVVYDPVANRTWEAVADLSDLRLESLKEVPGVQPALSGQDSEQAARIVRADSRWLEAMHERGITDLSSVDVVAWTAGYFALPIQIVTVSSARSPITPRRIITSTPIPLKAWSPR